MPDIIFPVDNSQHLLDLKYVAGKILNALYALFHVPHNNFPYFGLLHYGTERQNGFCEVTELVLSLIFKSQKSYMPMAISQPHPEWGKVKVECPGSLQCLTPEVISNNSI